MPEIKLPMTPEVKFTKKGVLIGLYVFFGLCGIYSLYEIVAGDMTKGLLLLVVAAVNAAWAIGDAKKSEWETVE